MDRKSEILGQELALLAHEIREPLASILFAVDCANQGGHDPFASSQWCEIIERQARYMAGVVQDILDASQAKHEKLLLNKELVDVCSIVEMAVETNIPQLRNREHRLIVSLPRESVLMIADRQRLQQIINNLLTNACKYTPPGGLISVAARIEGDMIGIEVHDTGIGIDPEVLPRVFDLFHQGGQSTSGNFSGLGIGLALVKLLVEIHGGNIIARSAGKGCGSAFVVRLPGAVTLSSASPDQLQLRPASRLLERAAATAARAPRYAKHL